MNKSPLVSVLMTSYNRTKYIGESIKSVINQTFTNWELIILDDCSTDNTYDIVESYAIKDDRIKPFRNDYNLGQFKNRNKIAELAQGHYIKYLDSDDLLYPFALEQFVFYINKFPNAAYGLCALFKEHERIFPFELTPKEAYEYHYLKKKKIFHNAPLSAIIRKTAFQEIGGFPHEAVSGDFAMWNKLSQKYSVVLLPHGFTWYRVHPEQELQKVRDNTILQFEYFLVAEHFIKSRLCPLREEERSVVLKEISKEKIKYIFWKTRTLGLKVGYSLYKFMRKDFHINPPFNKNI